jgi:integrase/recombinase XerD
VRPEPSGQRRRAVRHRELGLGAVRRDGADLGEELRCRELGDTLDRGETALAGRTERPDLVADLLERSRQLPQAGHARAGHPGPDAAGGGEEPSRAIEVPSAGQPSDPLLVARVEVLQIGVPSVGHAIPLRAQLTPMVDQHPQVFERAIRATAAIERSPLRQSSTTPAWPSSVNDRLGRLAGSMTPMMTILPRPARPISAVRQSGARPVAARAAAGQKSGRSTVQAARTFCARVERAGGFERLSSTGRLDAVRRARAFVSWLLVRGELVVEPEILGLLDLRLGGIARIYCPDAHAWFVEACARLGTPDGDVAVQWNALLKVTALTGTPADQIGEREFGAARTAIIAAYAARRLPQSGRGMAAHFHRLQLTLFHAGRLDSLARPLRREPVSVSGWAAVAPAFAGVARRYVDQVALSLRPATVKHIEHDLREFGTWLAVAFPAVETCAALERHHIEAYKAWVAAKPARYTGKPLNRISIKNRLINLHCFFDRITEWGYPDPPQRPLLFAGDLPIVDKPLPRFLDDAAAARLMRASRADPDPLSRLIVELLARTGIRKGELLGLTVDAVVQIGSAFWLRIPVGKLHNDRYIPLHPQLKELLDDWIANHRPSGLRSERLLLERNRPVTSLRVASALRRLGGEAGIGHVTAHQLRHTLATQAINVSDQAKPATNNRVETGHLR